MRKSSRASRVRRTQTERRDESERGLMKAAIAVVSEEGVSAATFETIARRGGYSRGLVTQRFGSKRGLIEAVIGYLRARPEAVAIEQRIDELSGLEGLLAYVDLYLQHLATDDEGQAYYRLLCSTLADKAPLHSLFAAEHERFRNRLVGLVLRGKAEKNIREETDPDAAGMMVGTLIFGIAMTVLIDPTLNIEPIRRTCEQTLRTTFAVTKKATRGP